MPQVYLMTPEEGGRKKPCTEDMQLMCFSKTWDCASFVKMVGKSMAMPGEDATMDFKLLKPMVLEVGQSFTVRDSAGTIGTGADPAVIILNSAIYDIPLSGKVTNINANLTEEEFDLMTMNKAKREKALAKKKSA